MTALTDPIPLRQSTVWGSFAAGAAVYLPHRYGAVGGVLIQYDRQRINFVWADHAVESIDAVLVDGVAAQGWTWANVLDVSGHTVAMVTMQSPIDLNANPTARGKGKLHPGTGELMTDPAAILWDVLANVAGRDLSESALASFSAACTARGLDACGSIETPDQVLAIAKAICDSTGAIFAPASQGLATLYPGVAALPLLTIDNKYPATCATSIASIINDITIRYAFEGGSPRQTIQLEAPDSVARFGRRAQPTFDAKWISSPRTAYDVALRILQQQARPQWNIHVTGIDRALKTGQGVTVNHSAIPVTGDHVITTSELVFSTGKTAIDIAAPAGSIPVTRIVQQSEAFDPQSYASVAVQTQGTDRIFTFSNNDLSPMVSASVLLVSAGVTRFTDAGGRVSFPVQLMPGPATYQLHVTPANGGTPFDAFPIIQ